MYTTTVLASRRSFYSLTPLSIVSTWVAGVFVPADAVYNPNCKDQQQYAPPKPWLGSGGLSSFDDEFWLKKNSSSKFTILSASFTE